MKNLFICLIILCAGFIQSCSSFLEETPYNKITAGNFYTTAKEAEEGVNGLYSKLRNLYGDGYIFYMCEAPSDIWKSAIGMDVEFRTWTIDATSSSVTALWNNCYITINQANTVIKALQNNSIPDLSENMRNQYLAEARFIRAHLYYHLVQQFGEVELRTEPTETFETKAYKTTVDKIWNFIIDELKFCIDNLPSEQSVYGRISKDAAKHHLARVYLTVKRNNDDIKEALRLSEEVIASPHHALMASHKDLWSEDNIRNSEILFSVLYTTNSELDGDGNRLHVMYTASYSDHYPNVLVRDLKYGRPWSRIRPTYYLQNLYDETRDARWNDCFRTVWCVNKNGEDLSFNPYTKKLESIDWKCGDTVMIVPKHTWSIEMVKSAWPKWVWMPDELRGEIQENIQSSDNPDREWPSNTRFQSGTMYPTLIKFQDSRRSSINDMKGVRDIVVFRLGETYLLAAEACYLLGDKDKAAEYINVIRRRAAISGKEKEMEVGPDMLDINFILDERARELAGEFERWYDLKRTNQLFERMNNPEMNEIVAGKFKEYHVLRPIPRDELSRISNPDEFLQNKGYGD